MTLKNRSRSRKAGLRNNRLSRTDAANRPCGRTAGITGAADGVALIHTVEDLCGIVELQAAVQQDQPDNRSYNSEKCRNGESNHFPAPAIHWLVDIVWMTPYASSVRWFREG